MVENPTTPMPTDLAVILDIMGIAFVEIRAANDLKTCKALANTFHNVPAQIGAGEAAVNILKEIFSQAKHSGIEPYILKLYEHSKSKFNAT